MLIQRRVWLLLAVLMILLVLFVGLDNFYVGESHTGIPEAIATHFWRKYYGPVDSSSFSQDEEEIERDYAKAMGCEPKYGVVYGNIQKTSIIGCYDKDGIARIVCLEDK